MKVVLLESNGRQHTGREFSRPVVKLGRDPTQCDVVFDQATWPTVSRVHAELHLQQGRCLLIDNNSSHGTYLNGQRVVGPVELQIGARIQLGASGPTLVVELIQSDQSVAPSSRVAPQPVQRDMTPPASTLQGPHLNVEKGEGQSPRRFDLKKVITLLGRDPTADLTVDSAAAVVSRRHAEVRRENNNQFILVDLNSFNGTFLNGRRIAHSAPLHDGDRIQLGKGGPILALVDPAHPTPATAPGGIRTSAPAAAVLLGAIATDSIFDEPGQFVDGQHTVVVRPESRPQTIPPQNATQLQLLVQCSFDGRTQLTVGRAQNNDIHLDGLLISNRHARFIRTSDGVLVEDAGSTNGVYVNGVRLSGRQSVQVEDVIQIGPFVLQADLTHGIAVFDSRSSTWLEAIEITRTVTNRTGRGTTTLLDAINIAIQPNEFVGLLGPSGAGKSTLMGALNGMSPAGGGRVLINNLDLYQHLDSLKQSIGYVPQDDIIHRELTIQRTLYYVARLRLSRDASEEDIEKIISDVLDVTGLAERRDTPVALLSGGQRKRVSIAVELITKPSVIFLDEPTSGLDPATQDKIMKFFREIAESGRTVILTTHATENVNLFDKVLVLMRGKLIFYGLPAEALDFVKAKSFRELYDKLEAPILDETGRLLLPEKVTTEQKRAREEQRNEIAERVAEEWRRRFLDTETYQRHVARPLSRVDRATRAAPVTHQRPTVIDSIRQWATLAHRYVEILWADKPNLLILFGQAPIVALLTYLVVGNKDPRDFPYFVLALVAIWFGASLSAREIVKERPVFRRERMVNLGLLPYVCSKIFVLLFIVAIQCILLFGMLKLLRIAGFALPGVFAGLPQLLLMILTGTVGIGLGLFVSAVVKTSEMATSLVPLILIPQILFAGLVGVPTGVSKVVGAVMPATWSFDEMKRLSGLDTLLEEGSNPHGENLGRGLYKHVEERNDQNIAQSRQQIEDRRRESEESLKAYERELKKYLAAGSGTGARDSSGSGPPPAPTLAPAPTIPEAEKIKDDLSGYVSFTHPWGNIALDPLVLMFMFFALVIATVVALRAKDAS
jgi:ABC-type multidrug transport system ATPase subunit